MNPLQAFQAGEEKKFDDAFPLREGAYTFSGKRAKKWLREHDARLISFLEGYVKPETQYSATSGLNTSMRDGYNLAVRYVRDKFRELRSNEQ